MNFSTRLKKLFYLIFLIIFTPFFLEMLLRNFRYDYNEPLLLFSFLITICLFYFFNQLYTRFQDFFIKKYQIIFPLFILFFFGFEITLGLFLEYDPLGDLYNVYHGAMEWVTTGSFLSQLDYFYCFPNNLGALSALTLFFKIGGFFGIHNYYLIALVANSFFIAIALSLLLYSSWLISKSLRSCYRILLFVLIFFPFLVLGSCFYTDGLSFIYPILIITLFLKSKEAKSNKIMLIYYILIGLVSFVGSTIKFTIVITLIAITIELLLNRQFKKGCQFFIIVGTCLFVFTSLFNNYFYTHYLDKRKAEVTNTPKLHWVMMGLRYEGAYNDEDYQYTFSLLGNPEINTILFNNITYRIQEMGPVNYTRLLNKKALLNFGGGTLGLSDFIMHQPKNNTFYHQFLIYNSKGYKNYSSIEEGIFLAMFLLCILTTFQFFRQNNDNIALPLSILGIFLFLLLWEANNRYFANFTPIMVLLYSLFKFKGDPL